MNYDDYKKEIEAETKRQQDLAVEFKTTYPSMFSSTDWLNLSIPKGWVGLLKDFAQKFSKEFPTIGIAQVKQKFGGLRIYPERTELSDATSANIHACINECVEKAENICEECGVEGATKNDRGFIQTLCEKCRNERD